MNLKKKKTQTLRLLLFSKTKQNKMMPRAVGMDQGGRELA
jgi:hypothetical protein